MHTYIYADAYTDTDTVTHSHAHAHAHAHNVCRFTFFTNANTPVQALRHSDRPAAPDGAHLAVLLCPARLLQGVWGRH